LNLPNRQKVEFLIDCGSFLEEETLEFNKDFSFNPSKLDFTVATHYHGDHTGRFAILYNRGYKGNIYASQYTSEYIKKRIIPACYDHKRSNPESEILWNEKDAIAVINGLRELEIDHTIKVHNNVEITFLHNAHCRGAIICRVMCIWENEKICAIFTGDYKEKSDVRKTWIPECYKAKIPVTIITEATYGLQNKPERTFDKLLKKSVVQGGSTLIASFGESMFESAINHIKQLKQKGEINPNIPIYIEINKMFEINNKILSSMPANVTFVKNVSEKSVAKYDKNQKIVIVTERGGLAYFLPYMIQDEKNMVLFTNHLPPKSKTREILETNKGETFIYSGKVIKKSASAYSIEEFGCHAFIEEIERLVKSFENVNGILFGHGDKQAKRAVVSYMGKKMEVKSFVLKRGRAFKITPKTVKYE